MTLRDFEIRISAASDKGFAIHEAGILVAALTTRAEVAQWIEDRLGEVPGEREQERQDIQDTRETFPRVIDRTDRKGWFRG